MSTKNELPLPAAAKGDPRSFELMRAWIADGDLAVSLQLGGWQEPEPWGVVLADVTRHLANFYAKQKGRDRDEVIEALRAGFLEELDSGADDTKGD